MSKRSWFLIAVVLGGGILLQIPTWGDHAEHHAEDGHDHRAMMEMTALLEKPENSTSGVNNCSNPGTKINKPSSVMISSAATSTRSNSVAKMYTANTTMIMTITISVVSIGSASISSV